MYNLEIMPKAEADFARLDATIEQRILDKLRSLCENCDTHRHEAPEAHIEESSAYALLMLTELSIPSIGTQEGSLFTKLDIGAVFISIDTKYTIHSRVFLNECIHLQRCNYQTV